MITVKLVGKVSIMVLLWILTIGGVSTRGDVAVDGTGVGIGDVKDTENVTNVG